MVGWLAPLGSGRAQGPGPLLQINKNWNKAVLWWWQILSENTVASMIYTKCGREHFTKVMTSLWEQTNQKTSTDSSFLTRREDGCRLPWRSREPADEKNQGCLPDPFPERFLTLKACRQAGGRAWGFFTLDIGQCILKHFRITREHLEVSLGCEWWLKTKLLTGQLGGCF